MKQPSKQMKRALRRNWSYLGEIQKETLTWINLTGSVKIEPNPDPTTRVRIRAEDVTIGESVSWHLGADKDGNAVPIYHEDEKTVKDFYDART